MSICGEIENIQQEIVTYKKEFFELSFKQPDMVASEKASRIDAVREKLLDATCSLNRLLEAVNSGEEGSHG